MKTKSFFAVLLFIFLATSCSKEFISDNSELALTESALKSAGPNLKIAVVSDIHYMDPTLLPVDEMGGASFQEYLAKDPKLLEFSSLILQKVISGLIEEKPDLVLIPGDLTKDGEKVSHQSLAILLKQLTNKGIKVFVIPGNHDIQNPYAYSFSSKALVNSITPDDFASIYQDYGYAGAVRDPNSLSYFYKINDKLWILGIDACKYEQNTTEPIVGGAIKPETSMWIAEQMANARNKNITVLTMMHHGILEHYAGQNLLDPYYVVDDWKDRAAELLNAGINTVFSGHYHANDITQFAINGKTMTDIETGSLVSWPSPYRIIKMYGNFMDIRTQLVNSIEAPNLPVDFKTYSSEFHRAHFDFYFGYALQLKFGLSQENAQYLAPLFRNGIMAHYAGDETLTSPDRDIIYGLSSESPQLSAALLSLWTDLNPKDNSITLKIK